MSEFDKFDWEYYLLAAASLAVTVIGLLALFLVM
jgi:hypothetical protein